MERNFKIAPSILSADFAQLGQEVVDGLNIGSGTQEISSEMLINWRKGNVNYNVVPN